MPREILDVVGFPNTEFNLTIGKQYTVYAMMIWKNVINYLVVSDDSLSPSWLPAHLFETTEPTLPKNWYFKYFRKHENPTIAGLSAIWGYEELITDEDHYRALTELEPDALEVFMKRKEAYHS